MHELGLIIDVVEKVDRIAEEQNLKKIDKVVLQVGEAFSVVPQMMKAVYRRSIPGTRLEGSALEIEIIEASAKCRNCGSVFNPFTCDAQCPCCQESEYTVLSGQAARGALQKGGQDCYGKLSSDRDQAERICGQ